MMSVNNEFAFAFPRTCIILAVALRAAVFSFVVGDEGIAVLTNALAGTGRRGGPALAASPGLLPQSEGAGGSCALKNILLQDARLVLNPCSEWTAIASRQMKVPQLWFRAAVVIFVLCMIDFVEISYCSLPITRIESLQSISLFALVLYIITNIFSIAIFLAAGSFVIPLLSKGMGGNDDSRAGVALAVYANVNAGWLALNILSLDATCHDAAARWVFSESLMAQIFSWGIFGAYVAYAVHLLRHGAIALLKLPTERATAYASVLVIMNLVGVWFAGLGPTPLVVLLSLVGL